MHDGQRHLQQQFREINIYKDLEDKAMPPAPTPAIAALRRKHAAKRPPIVASQPEETTDEDATPLRIKADAKAFRRRNDMEKIGMKMIQQPAEHGTRHNTYTWVAQKENILPSRQILPRELAK